MYFLLMIFYHFYDKKIYLKHLEKNKIPISPTMFISKKVNPSKLLNDIKNKKMEQFYY